MLNRHPLLVFPAFLERGPGPAPVHAEPPKVDAADIANRCSEGHAVNTGAELDVGDHLSDP